MSADGDARLPSVPAAAAEVLESVYQHRLLSTRQVHALHHPHASRAWTHRLLSRLRGHGLLDRVHAAAGSVIWFITQHGAETVEAISNRVEPRRRVGSHAHAVGPLRAHTVALNDACIAFTAAARDQGDDCGPLAWRHEISHQLRRASPRDPYASVISDALLSYLQTTPEAVVLHQRLVELDRATNPVEHLARKLARYQQLHDQPPATPDSPRPDWRERYRTFPAVLVVLAGRTPRAALTRIQQAIALHNNSPASARTIAVSFVALTDLVEHGPFAPIFINTQTPERYLDWLNNPPTKG